MQDHSKNSKAQAGAGASSPAAQAAAFKGIWPAMLTPLGPTGAIDHALFAAHARHLIDAGCTGVTPFGTTGEGPSFSVDERMAAIQSMVDAGVPGERIIVSTSAAALPDVIALTRHAMHIGAHGCLLMPPFYFKGVSDEGVIATYRQVIDGVADSRLRLYLYHIPQISGVPLSHAVIAELARLYPDTIAGIKDSGCVRLDSLALARAFMPAVMVYVGNELDLPELARCGSTGAISGLANMLPAQVRRLVTEPDSAQSGDELARIAALLALLGDYPLVPALKLMMALSSGEPAWRRPRAPLAEITGAAAAELEAGLRAWFAATPA
jgi:4-hydroxy-tetrahydrodipicolinate synthase